MFHSSKVVALVPIKEHSERVPEKNFRSFAGAPLYHHIIRALDRTYAVDEIVINTDSPRVMREAPGISRKVTIHERPDELIGDTVSTNDIFAWDLARTEGGIYIQTHATNPLLRPETISRGLRLFSEKAEDGCDSLFSVTTHQNRFYDCRGQAINHDPEHLLRTQDLNPIYEENSCLYVFTEASFALANSRIGANPVMFPTPPVESFDIDDEFTFRLAELLALYAAVAADVDE